MLSQQLRLLAFLPARPNISADQNWYLSLAVFGSWLAGIGRYWDHPNAHWWQYAGLGSVVYIGVLALFLWAIAKPLKPQNWSYLSVFVFVGLTAPPAMLYAIPVERFVPLSTAAAINVWFLAIVATWRVALYGVFLRRVAKLNWFPWLVALLLPLVVIVGSLAMLNLEQAVFSIMGGLDRDPTAADQSYRVIVLLTFFSAMAAPVLFIGYLVACYRAQKTHQVVAKEI